MSGLVTETTQKGRGSGLSQGFTFRRFTTAGSTTIVKPYGCTMIIIECIGAGGGGAAGYVGGGSAANRCAGGGGGGAFARMSFPAESLGETLTITVPAGGARGESDSSDAPTDGTAGGVCSVTDDDSSKIIIAAYGGGGGAAPIGAEGGGGGGGGTVPSVLLLELLRLLMEATLLFKALPGQPKVWV